MGKVNSIDIKWKYEINNNIEFTTINAGHLPWSTQIILKIKSWKNKYINIAFSWDLWKIKNSWIYWSPEISKTKLDLYVVESTYAWRFHPDIQKEENDLVKSINNTIEKWWKIIIPSFVQWRAQEWWLYFNKLIEDKKISKIDIFYDSSSIGKILEIYNRHYPEIFWELNKKNFKRAYTWKWKNKQEHFINTKKSAILFASWWMMNWWTVEKYLDYLLDSKNLFISIWYQSSWTTWNQIFTQLIKEIEYKNKWKFKINANIHNFRWLSGHADEEDLLNLLSKMNFSKDAKVVINHWEAWVTQTIFWLAVKQILWKVNVVLADFNESFYK